MKLLWLLIGQFSFKFHMARTKKTLRIGEGKRALQVKWITTPSTSRPPAPEVEPGPTQSELERTVEEAEKLGEVGSLPESSPTWQLAQMAVEARPSMSGREELARRKLWPTMGGKASRRNSSGLKSEEAPKVLTGDSAFLWDPSISEKHWPFNLQTPLFAFSQ